jgi:hypothetical protein
MPAFTRVGLDALLTPKNCVVLLIDHQPFQLANVNSHEPAMVPEGGPSLSCHLPGPSPDGASCCAVLPVTARAS